MKIGLCGPFAPGDELYQPAFARALRSLGHEVCEFQWGKYFTGYPKFHGYMNRRELPSRLALQLMSGPRIRAMNAQCLAWGQNCRPDFWFFWNSWPIYPDILRKLKSLAPVALYTNDNPFVNATMTYHWPLRWRFWKQQARLADVIFYFRDSDLARYRSWDMTECHLFPAYFVPELHRPIQLTPEEQARWASDLVFIGRYEPVRAEWLRKLLGSGFQVQVYGTGWPRKAWPFPVQAVRGEDYLKALCGAKIALGFLSNLAHDRVTSRTFEIPACGAVMAALDSPELRSLFEPEKEIILYHSFADLVDKLRHYLRHPEKLRSISLHAVQRCRNSRYDIASRAAVVVQHLQAWLNQVSAPRAPMPAPVGNYTMV